MKNLKYIGIILCFFCGVISAKAVELDIKSQNAILVNLDENKVLYEKNSEEQVAIASLTKLMTAIVAIENIESLDDTVMIDSSDFSGLAEANAAVAGFRIGQTVTYRDLLYGLLLPSGADAASTLARVITGNKDTFIDLMNEKAASLGLTNTHFTNTTGLDAENHYSTAKEMASIFAYALQNQELKQILETSRYTISDGSFSVLSTIQKNINQYHLELDYITGGKTGTTENAGLCLASIASRNGTNYMLVTLRAPQEGQSPNSFYDAQTIYGYFIENYHNETLLEEGEVLITLNPKYTKEDISFTLNEPVIKYVENNYNKEDVKINYLEEVKIKSNTKLGTKLGKIQITYQEELVKEIPVILETTLHFDMGNFFRAHWFVISIIFIILLFLLRILSIWNKKRKRRKRRKQLQKRKNQKR